MRNRRMLPAIALSAAAVLLGMLTVQGTYALWSMSVRMEAETIQAADFTVSLSGEGIRHMDMTLPNGAPATLALSTAPTGALRPGGTVYAGIVVTNETNASADFTVEAKLPVAPIVHSPELGRFLKVRSAAAGNLASCSDPALFAAAPEELPSFRLAKGEARAFCFQVELADDVPASLEGSSTGISIPLSAAQM